MTKGFKKANPADLRISMEVANYLKNHGILFVPIPVYSETDFVLRVQEMLRELEKIPDRNISATLQEVL